MSDSQFQAGDLDPLIQPFVEFWSSYIQTTNDATRQLIEGMDGPSDAKTWQRRWFDAVSQSMDAYMRSPAFLQAMKHNADMVVKAKRQANDFFSEFARNANVPTVGDISGLFERLHSVEEVILKRLGHIEERLSNLEGNSREGEESNE